MIGNHSSNISYNRFKIINCHLDNLEKIDRKMQILLDSSVQGQSSIILFVATENALGQIKKYINTVAAVLEILINIIIQTNYKPCKEYNKSCRTHSATHTQTI